MLIKIYFLQIEKYLEIIIYSGKIKKINEGIINSYFYFIF